MNGDSSNSSPDKNYEENMKYKIGGVTFNVKHEYSGEKKMSELLTGYILKKEKL